MKKPKLLVPRVQNEDPRGLVGEISTLLLFKLTLGWIYVTVLSTDAEVGIHLLSIINGTSESE